MNYIIRTVILLTVFSCSNKDKNLFTIELPHYSCQIQVNAMKDFDTLLVWDWYNDNMADDRRCYRLQDSKLGIAMDNGMLLRNYPEKYNQMTIKAPIEPNKFGPINISKWIKETKETYSSENSRYKFPIVDSLSINGRKFGVLSMEKEYYD